MSEPVAKKPRKMPESVHENKLENGSSNGCETNGLSPSKAEVNGTVENGGKGVDGEKSHADNSVLLCKRLSDDATLPTRGSSSAAGFDLYSACDVIVGKKNKEMVPTQIAITVPLGSYGRIAPRSGLAKNNFIDVGAGVVDHDYTGEVKVLLFNFSDDDFEVKKGHRIAQLVIEKIFMPELKEVEDLPKTKRGATGFGASGK